MAYKMRLLTDSHHARPTVSWFQDMIAAALGLVLSFGLISDSIYQTRYGDYSAVAPLQWAVYLGALLVAGWSAWLAWQRHRAPATADNQGNDRPRTGLSAIPTGYGPFAIAVPLIIISGLVGLVWHVVFGVEQSRDAVLSPPHLGLAVGYVLLLAGPWLSQRALRRDRVDQAGVPHRLLRDVPTALALGSMFAVFILTVPYVFPVASSLKTLAVSMIDPMGAAEATGLAASVAATIVSLAVVVVSTRHHRPVFGFFLVASVAPAFAAGSFIGGDTLLMVVAVLAVGLLEDVLVWLVWPQLRRRRDLLVLGVAWPVAVWTAAVVVIEFRYGAWLGPEAIVGLPLLNALVGALLMLFVKSEQLPPPPEADSAENPFDDVIRRAKAMTDRSED
ncbi:hypothetical protein [Salininema proteolyticum]|uniref:Uncharacterized protein n=1 Tax=Salininema proteolyticum TaxID=1607685 RepID=A0ABV8TW85_9ACTN